jgi:dihydrofolate reductase
VLGLSKYLNGDLFIIGGAKTYANFADVIDKWIVTEVPDALNDADTFMAPDFLNGYEQTEAAELDGGLSVKTFQRP